MEVYELGKENKVKLNKVVWKALSDRLPQNFFDSGFWMTHFLFNLYFSPLTNNNL